MDCNYVIKNGSVYDGGENDAVQDIAVHNGVIVACGKNLPLAGEQVIDAAGCFVIPGLIDFHTHLYEWGSESGINANIAFLPCGVTTAVDAGSAGISNYELFSRHCIAGSEVTIKSFLNISPAGLVMVRHHSENVNPEIFHSAQIARVIDRHRGEIIGLKIRINRAIVGDRGLEPLRATVRIGEELGIPVMVHPIDPSQDVDAIFDILRPGDIFSHMYHSNGYGILGADGRIKRSAFEARRKGILFEVAAGRDHCALEVARQAIAEGFWPDIVSTDETSMSMFRPPLFSLPHLLSKFLALGIPIRDLVRMTTAAPARFIGALPPGGLLSPGSRADLAIFRLVEQPGTRFTFANNVQMVGNQLMIVQMTVKNGRVMYRHTGF